MAQARQRNGEIHGNGGLSDAAFARSDGDQIMDAGNRDFRLFGLRCVGTHQFDGSRGARRRSRGIGDWGLGIRQARGWLGRAKKNRQTLGAEFRKRGGGDHGGVVGGKSGGGEKDRAGEAGARARQRADRNCKPRRPRRSAIARRFLRRIAAARRSSSSITVY